MKSPVVYFVASLLIVLAALAPASLAQSATSGAITGSAIDPTGAVVVGAEITLTNDATGDVRTAVSTSSGAFLFPLLSPGSYTLRASKAGFKELVRTGVVVTVTETVRANLQLQIGKVSESVMVTAEGELLKTEDSALGDVTNARAVLSLPLASRNYTQIIGLSPGVSSEVTDAGALGRGTGSDAAGDRGFSSHGASTTDNNYQVNGVEVDDLMGSANLSGGVAVPNPDSIQEFKVQTGQYDASYGRNAGANVDLVTKTGGNQVHGSLFEFFRNEDLNANTYFQNRNNQPRGVFKQNQFGGSLGGHIVKDKLFYFGSYQGTRQRNGLAGGRCATGVLSPPLTDTRDRQTLGALFSGPTEGAIAADGSNISDQAFALLNLKLANGKFAIPTPQTVDPTQPFFTEGSSSFSQSCPFTEDQFLVDADYLLSAKSSLSGSFLFSNTSTTETLNTNGNIPGSGVPGSPATTLNQYRVFSLVHRYSFSSNLINQASLGFHRLVGNLVQTAPFKFSDIDVTVPAFEDSFPNVGVSGSFQIGGNGQGVELAQNAYNFSDAISWTRGRHSLHFGGGIERSQINQTGFHFLAGLGFPDYEQFLLGTANVGIDLPGLFDRYWRTWDGNLYAQDNIKITSKFTVNLGLRYERLGDLGDTLGRNSSFDPLQADHTGEGSQAGYVVASNFSGGALPPGVIRAPNQAATNGLGQNTWGPRVGFSWQMPGSDRVVLRGGYGIFYSRTTAQPILQELTSPPFGQVRVLQIGIPFANPFPPAPAIPSFPTYSLATCPLAFSASCVAFINVGVNLKPPAIQQYSLGTQVALARDLSLEIGYQGARGTKLTEARSFNQALSASVSNPVNGATDNTIFNVTQRSPVPGVSPSQTVQTGSTGASWYNALTVSLNKRISKGLQFLASYTWSSSLSTSQGFSTGTQLGGLDTGDQNNPRERYGWDTFDRPQRFILSWVYQFPAFDHRSFAMRKVLGGWSVAGVTTIQSGQRLSVTATNVQNVFGTLRDRAPLSASGCGTHFVNSGTVQSKLGDYINASCFDLTNYAVIGDDGIGTGFGNSGIGEVRGPGQNNWDLSLQKATGLTERVQLQFRSDFFNAFNHPQFSNPDLNLGTVAAQLGIVFPNAGFGTIATTGPNPRVLQFSLRLVF